MVGFIEFYVIEVPSMCYFCRVTFCVAICTFPRSIAQNGMWDAIDFLVAGRTNTPMLFFIIFYDFRCIVFYFFCRCEFNAANIAVVRICTNSIMLVFVKNGLVTIDANDPVVFFVMIKSRALYMRNVAAIVFCTASAACARIATGCGMGFYI